MRSFRWKLVELFVIIMQKVSAISSLTMTQLEDNPHNQTKLQLNLIKIPRRSRQAFDIHSKTPEL